MGNSLPINLLLGNTEEDRKTTLNLHHHFRFNAPEGLTQLVASDGHCSVHHDLRESFCNPLSALGWIVILNSGAATNALETSRTVTVACSSNCSA